MWRGQRPRRKQQHVDADRRRRGGRSGARPLRPRRRRGAGGSRRSPGRARRRLARHLTSTNATGPPAPRDEVDLAARGLHAAARRCASRAAAATTRPASRRAGRAARLPARRAHLQLQRPGVERLAVEPGGLGDLRRGLRGLARSPSSARSSASTSSSPGSRRDRRRRPAARSRPWADAPRSARPAPAAMPRAAFLEAAWSARARPPPRGPGSTSPIAASDCRQPRRGLEEHQRRRHRAPARPAHRARALSLAGRKPANRKRSLGRPDSVSATTAALGPGRLVTAMPRSRASRTRR